jgi:hypothetical protein
MLKKVVILLTLAFFLASFINKSDLLAFKLQQAGIASVGGEQTFNLRSVIGPIFNNLGDTVNYSNKLYALKAPGLFIVGGSFYFILLQFGYTYLNNYLEISFIITILLAVLPTIGLFYFSWQYFENKLNFSHKFSFFLSLFLLIATMLMSYSGVAGGDIIALFIIFTAFILDEIDKYKNKAVISFLLGFSILFSYKAIIFSALLFLFLWWQDRNWRNVLAYLLGTSFLLFYHFYLFNNPFITPHYLLSNQLDVFPKLVNINFRNKFIFYFLDTRTSIFANNLILIPAIMGLIWNYKNKMVKKIGIISIVYLIYLFLMKTVGDCQYPPRYLLMLIPFWYLGLPLLLIKCNTLKKYIWLKVSLYVIIICLLIISIISNLTAALFSVMNCNYSENIWQLTFLNITKLNWTVLREDLILSYGFLVILIPIIFILFSKEKEDL